MRVGDVGDARDLRWIALHKDSSQIVTTVIFTAFLCAMVAIAITVFYSFNIEGRMVEGMFTEDQFSSAYKQLAGGQSYGAEGETKAARRHDRPRSESKQAVAPIGADVWYLPLACALFRVSSCSRFHRSHPWPWIERSSPKVSASVTSTATMSG